MLPKVLTKPSGVRSVERVRLEQFIFGFQGGAFGGKGRLAKCCETQLENGVFFLSFRYFQAVNDVLQQEQQCFLFIVRPVDQTSQGLCRLQVINTQQIVVLVMGNLWCVSCTDFTSCGPAEKVDVVSALNVHGPFGSAFSQ